MGLLGKLLTRGKREEKLTTAPVGKPKARVYRAGQRRTREQVAERRRAMAGRKDNVRRMRKKRGS